MAHTVEEMIDKYVAAWNYNNLDEFKQAFTEVWAAHAKYTDPNFPLVEGVKGISELAQFSLEKIPGRKFFVVTPPQHHNQACLYTWGVDIPGMGQREGQDYIEYNEAFKIVRLISFFKPF